MRCNIKSERGFAFIEILVSIALLGAIAAIYLGAIGTNYQVTSMATEKAVAQKIASYRIINNVQNVPFQQVAVPSYAKGIITDCSDINIFDVKNNPINCMGYTTQISSTTVNNTPLLGNEIIQKITVAVMYKNKIVTSLQNYKWLDDSTN